MFVRYTPKDKNQVYALRKQGYTYQEINYKTEVSTSTIYNWLKGLHFGKTRKKNTAKTSNGRRRNTFNRQ